MHTKSYMREVAEILMFAIFCWGKDRKIVSSPDENVQVVTVLAPGEHLKGALTCDSILVRYRTRDGEVLEREELASLEVLAA